MKTTVYHQQGLHLLDAITDFSFVYILPLRWGVTCEFARYLGSSVLAMNLNLIGRFVTPGSIGSCYDRQPASSDLDPQFPLRSLHVMIRNPQVETLTRKIANHEDIYSSTNSPVSDVWAKLAKNLQPSV